MLLASVLKAELFIKSYKIPTLPNRGRSSTIRADKRAFLIFILIRVVTVTEALEFQNQKCLFLYYLPLL